MDKRWVKEPPTEPGFYWAIPDHFERQADGYHARPPAEVVELVERDKIYRFGNDCWSDPQVFAWWWPEPMAAPPTYDEMTMREMAEGNLEQIRWMMKISGYGDSLKRQFDERNYLRRLKKP